MGRYCASRDEPDLGGPLNPGDCKTRASPSGKLIICVQLGTPPRDTVQELLARDPREEA
jgi:hypothetical protein